VHRTTYGIPCRLLFEFRQTTNFSRSHLSSFVIVSGQHLLSWLICVSHFPFVHLIYNSSSSLSRHCLLFFLFVIINVSFRFADRYLIEVPIYAPPTVLLGAGFGFSAEVTVSEKKTSSGKMHIYQNRYGKLSAIDISLSRMSILIAFFFTVLVSCATYDRPALFTTHQASKRLSVSSFRERMGRKTKEVLRKKC